MLYAVRQQVEFLCTRQFYREGVSDLDLGDFIELAIDLELDGDNWQFRLRRIVEVGLCYRAGNHGDRLACLSFVIGVDP